MTHKHIWHLLSLPAMSETLPAETENGNSVAVKTKLDKRFIVLYSLK